jgi:hypothetical protein
VLTDRPAQLPGVPGHAWQGRQSGRQELTAGRGPDGALVATGCTGGVHGGGLRTRSAHGAEGLRLKRAWGGLALCRVLAVQQIILSDRIATTPEMAPIFAESLLLMPHCYIVLPSPANGAPCWTAHSPLRSLARARQPHAVARVRGLPGRRRGRLHGRGRLA